MSVALNLFDGKLQLVAEEYSERMDETRIEVEEHVPNLSTTCFDALDLSRHVRSTNGSGARLGVQFVSTVNQQFEDQLAKLKSNEIVTPYKKMTIPTKIWRKLS